ncbi:MAG: hypothetical protein JWN14_958, partial [Chthonomonadales bacterium]|nr:hypothetical protein [Chthonomonadales bacterium]
MGARICFSLFAILMMGNLTACGA